jgi:superfamily II DNA or RNA helicase
MRPVRQYWPRNTICPGTNDVSIATAPTLFDLTPPGSRAAIIPRYYQVQDHDETFRVWDSGATGVLTRGFTGSGKTLQTCLKIDTWLRRGLNYRAMVISYEQELVHQFAREVWDYLGKQAGIEMGEQRVDYQNIPEIVIASRQSLLCWPEPTQQQRIELETFGIADTQSCCERHVARYLKLLKAGKAEPEDVRGEIGRLSMEPEAHNGKWSRVHRFDWHHNWLLAFDEAHKHAYHLKTVGHLIDWFGQNPESRWSGATATPKRGDGVSIGHKMFPGIALDLPLFKPGEPCGVSDGWAVPYVQRYIEVEGVDFRSINRIGKDFDEADLERVLGKEETLAKLIEPLLDMVEDRQTLIFSPGVQMAKDVAEYINARSRCVCTCGEVKWHPTLLIGDGAACPHCGRLAEPGDIDKRPEQAKELDGDIPTRDRTPVYEDHQAGRFQFLSVCGLCREGYNDPSVACVAVFRPVSRAASSLAEQMKGRSCRPLRDLLNQWPHADQRDLRLDAIRNSSKPNSLIVDLVGITGLADCASTIQIYAEGLPDEISRRAEELLLAKGTDGTADVGEAVEQAKREDAEARARAKAEREAAERHSRELAERRAKAGADVSYTVHESGIGSQVTTNEATEKQYRMAAFLGMDIQNTLLTKRQMGRIIGQLQARLPLEEIARTNGLDSRHWQSVGPTAKQTWAMHGLPADWVKTRADASLVLDAKMSPANFFSRMHAAVSNCQTPDSLTNIARDIGRVHRTVRLDPAEYTRLIEAGRRKRAQLSPTEF